MTAAEAWGIATNGLWIVGLAILLATWSYGRWAAQNARVKTRIKLQELRYALALDLGLLLFVIGMAATESRRWAQVIWALLGLVVVGHAALRISTSRGSAQ
jgi:hypothetical protein